MSKSPDAFRTISEVAEWLDTPAHVLRFWESKFTQVKPVKRAGGRRYYRPNDMRLLGGIKKLLHEDGMTIKGVQKILREQGVKHVSSICPLAVGDEDGAGQEASPAETRPEPPRETVVPFVSPERTVAEDAAAITDALDPEFEDAGDLVMGAETEDLPFQAEDQFSVELSAGGIDDGWSSADIDAEPGDDVSIDMGDRARVDVDLGGVDDNAVFEESAASHVEDEASLEVASPAGEGDGGVSLEKPAEEPEVPQSALPGFLTQPKAEPSRSEAPTTTLSALAKVRSLTPELAAEIAPLIERLRQLAETQRGTGR